MSLLDLAEYGDISEELPREPECSDCGSLLTVTEFIYYATRCEDCEVAHNERMQAWRAGECDVEIGYK